MPERALSESGLVVFLNLRGHLDHLTSAVKTFSGYVMTAMRLSGALLF
jgi:hypothetical protein